MFFCLNGVPSKVAPSDIYFFEVPDGSVVCSLDLNIFEIERVCVSIHELIAGRVFEGYENYCEVMRYVPEFVYVCGLNSESSLSKDEFSGLISSFPDGFPINQLLYIFDFRKLVSSIQESVKEVSCLMGDFYRELNVGRIDVAGVGEPDGLRWDTSPSVTRMHAQLGFIFIRLHSALDYLTKLSFEAFNFQSDFGSYRRLRSKDMLFGHRFRVGCGDVPGTIFSRCDEFIEIEEYRNKLVHDGFLDDMPKAYKVVRGGRCVERFVLVPDRGDGGRLVGFVNRNLFYSGEDKINLRLPKLVESINSVILSTLVYLRGKF